MSRSKLFFGVVLTLAIIFAQVGKTLAAAPQQDAAYITGSVQAVGFEAESTSDELRSLKTFDQQPPVGSTHTDLFEEYELAIGSPSAGFGFGMLAQALWMTEKLNLDGTFFQTILDAKMNGDYDQVFLPDGTIPQNWGQLKNAVIKGEEDNSLGDVVSNNNKPSDLERGQGNNHETPPGQSKDKDDDHGWRKNKPDAPPGQAKDTEINGNGNHPVTPPGQDKEKGKDKDKDKETGNSENGKPK